MDEHRQSLGPLEARGGPRASVGGESRGKRSSLAMSHRMSMSMRSRLMSRVSATGMMPGDISSHGGRTDTSATQLTGKPSKTKTTTPVRVKSRVKSNPPTGVLAVHVKQVRLLPWNPMQMFDRLDICVYVRIHVNGNCKWTSAFDYITFPAGLIFDDLKHFKLEVSDRREDEANNIVVELVGFDRPDVHRVIARHYLHLYSIIKQLYAVETYTMWRLDKPVAELEVEYCFAYGELGYGCANQLENRKITPKDQVAHSMFYRLEPPEGRRGGKPSLDTMTCVPVGHPTYIPFTSKAEIGDVALAYSSDLDLIGTRLVYEPTHTILRVKKRLTSMHREFSQLPTRKGRIKWLKDIVYSTNLTETTGEEVLVPHNFSVRRRTLVDSQRPELMSKPREKQQTMNLGAVRGRRGTVKAEDLKAAAEARTDEAAALKEEAAGEGGKKRKKTSWNIASNVMKFFTGLGADRAKEKEAPKETDEEYESRMMETRRKSLEKRRDDESDRRKSSVVSERKKSVAITIIEEEEPGEKDEEKPAEKEEAEAATEGPVEDTEKEWDIQKMKDEIEEKKLERRFQPRAPEIRRRSTLRPVGAGLVSITEDKTATVAETIEDEEEEDEITALPSSTPVEDASKPKASVWSRLRRSTLTAPEVVTDMMATRKPTESDSQAGSTLTVGGSPSFLSPMKPTAPSVRRPSLWDRAGFAIKSLVTTQEESPKHTLPRVMITPPTPEDSSDSEYDDEYDD